MPTRKQRRRRLKTFRHEYGFVMNDEEGNEVELAGSEIRAQRGAPAKSKPQAKAASGGSKPRRLTRDPLPPTWNRAVRRAAIYGIGIIVLSALVFRNLALPVRIALGVGYTILFVPMTYWLDGVVYRRWEKKQEGGGRSSGGRTNGQRSGR